MIVGVAISKDIKDRELIKRCINESIKEINSSNIGFVTEFGYDINTIFYQEFSNKYPIVCLKPANKRYAQLGFYILHYYAMCLDMLENAEYYIIIWNGQSADVNFIMSQIVYLHKKYFLFIDGKRTENMPI